MRYEEAESNEISVSESTLRFKQHICFQKFAWFLFGFCSVIAYYSLITTIDYIDSQFSFSIIAVQITLFFGLGRLFGVLFGPYISQIFTFKHVLSASQLLMILGTVLYQLVAYYLSESHFGYALLLILILIIGISSSLFTARLMAYSSFFDQFALEYFLLGIATTGFAQPLLRIIIIIIWDDNDNMVAQIVGYIGSLVVGFIIISILLFHYMKTNKVDMQIKTKNQWKVFDFPRAKKVFAATWWSLIVGLVNTFITCMIFPSIIIYKDLEGMSTSLSMEIYIFVFGLFDAISRYLGKYHPKNFMVMTLLFLLTKFLPAIGLLVRYYSTVYLQSDFDGILLTSLFGFVHGYYHSSSFIVQQSNKKQLIDGNKEYGSFIMALFNAVGSFLGPLIQLFL